jgi:predicted transcriptional regulator
MSFLKDIVQGVATVAGTVIGVAGGLTVAAVAGVLGITEQMVRQAMDAGCKTVEEIKEFWER